MENITLFVSVVVVSSRQTSEKLHQCLSSIFLNHYPADSFEVVVVDSGAGALVQNYLQREKEKRVSLQLVFPGEGNIGPARGRNLGIKAARGEVVAFTDDDIVVASDWLEKLVDGYRRYPAVAGVGGLTLPREDCLKSSLWAQYENRLYLGLLKRTQGEYLSEKRDEHPAYAGNISYRKRILAEVGGFDEDFLPIIYGEDGDLKERVLQLGYRLLYVPVVNRHAAGYSFRSFWQKEERRGRGILFYQKRHAIKKPHRVVEALKAGLFLVVFFRHLVRSRDLRFSGAAVLAFWARQAGKLRYYAKV